jgi:hypothetical protein
LTQAEVDSDSDKEDLSADDERDSAEEQVNLPNIKGKERAKPEWNTKRRTDLAKRSSKHA